MTELEYDDYATQVARAIRDHASKKPFILIAEEESVAPPNELQRLLDSINANWNVDAQRQIYSVCGFFNPLLNGLKRLVYGEVRASIEPFLARQILLNAEFARLFNSVNTLLTMLQEEREEILKQIFLLRTTVRRLSQANETMSEQAYAEFTERFRGPSEKIKKRQEVYAELFDGCDKVFDIGCGRGEFLEILRKRGRDAYGVDLNKDFVELCTGKRLNVVRGDALSYLKSLPDGSAGGIFSSQFIEHLDTAAQLQFISLCYEKLKAGGPLVIETLNPTALLVLAGPYLADPTHQRALYPETLRFLLESKGFRDVQIRFVNPYPQELLLNQVELNQDVNVELRDVVKTINENFSKLNGALWGPQDFVAIARK